MKVIRIQTYHDSIEANIAKAKLQSEGIGCFITNENFSVLQPGFSNRMIGGIDLMINEIDLEKAKKILDFTVEDDAYKCPYCGSKNIVFSFGKNAVSQFFLIIFAIFTFRGIKENSNEYYCRSCHKSFPHPEENK